MVSSAQLYLGLVALLIFERGFELVLSKRNAKRAFAEGAWEIGAAHFRSMVVLHAAFFLSCVAEVVLVPRAFPRPWGWIFLCGVVLAQGLRYWAIATLGERWNVRIIVSPRAEVVTRGPYKYLRHPNYLAVALEIALIPLLHGAWLTAVLFSLANAAVLSIRIRAEEEALGDLYAKYFAELPRFLPHLPRLSRR